MKIAINCAFFQPKGGGIKEYIQNIVENLSLIDQENNYVLYALKDYIEYARSELKTDFKIKPIPFNGNGIVNTVIRSSLEYLFWKKEEKREQWDIFHSPFFHGPKLDNTKLLLTVHDMRFYRYPETYTFLRHQFLKYSVKQSIKIADKIIAISQFTKDEIIDAYGTDPEKIQVIHEAINLNHFTNSKITSEESRKIQCLKGNPFIMSVGHLEPRKNYDRLINAFELAKPNLPQDTKLVIIGKKGHGFHSTLDKIQKNNNIIYLDFVSQPLLNWLYDNTSLFVFPSFYEGFGFPPLEAGTHGAISAVSNASCIPEICGNAALYFDPFDIVSISNSMISALTDESLRMRLLVNMKKRLSQFSWKNNAIKTLSLYKSLIEKKQ